MQKITIVIMLAFIVIISGCAKKIDNTVKNSYYIEKNKKLVIFSKDYILKEKYIIDYLQLKDYKNLFDPTIEEAFKSLEILKECPKIKEADINLEEYKKQVFGLDNKDGNIVQIVLAKDGLDKENFPDWQNNLMIMFDGEKSYFKVKININENRCFDFDVNRGA